MDWNALVNDLSGSLGQTLPMLVGALGILLVGWFVAVVVRAVVRGVLGRLKLNERLAESTGNSMDVAGGVAKGAYWVVFLVALVAFFNALELDGASTSLQALVDQVLGFMPKIIAAGVLLLVAWVLAVIARTGATKALGATSIDEKLAGEAEMRPMSESLGNILYGLVFLLFMPAILDALEMQGLLEPVQTMLDQMLGMLPNIFAAGVIGFVGFFVARLVRDLITNLLAATGADRFGQQAGLSGTTNLSGLVGLVAYIFILVPALIAALNALKIDVISEPATAMLGTFMAALPNVFAAAIILAVAWFISSFIATLTTNLLGGMGFDALPAKLGVANISEGETTPSQIAGKGVVFFLMLFAVVEAANRLGFGQVSEIVATLIAFGGQVLLGGVIIAAGVWIANLVHGAMQRVSGDDAPTAGIARFAILGLVLAMGLRAMGLADDIVNLAFGLTLGAIAVAFALSFGLGGREAAGEHMHHWLSQFRSK
ncbi:MAG: mechanosensitive ion channel [Myxococcota bacterium]